MGALDGLLVVAIEQAVAAPLCTVRLADAGARVIKIERSTGETARHYDQSVHGTSAYFAWLNRGKESVVLDLKSDAGLTLLRNMLRKADVLVQNLAPGALDRMGLSAEVLAAEYPHLIAVSIVGYGQDTNYASMRAYDMLVQAESGLSAVTGTPDTPSKVGVSAADIATGGNAHAAILEALIQRGKTERGQSIEIAMFDSMADWMTVPLLHLEHGGTKTNRFGLAHASIYPYRPFACSDGTVIIAVQTPEEWRRFCTGVLDRPDLQAHPDFATNPLRVRNRTALDAIMEPIMTAMAVDDVSRRCEAAGIAWSHYRDVQGLSQHPALRRSAVALPEGQMLDLPRPAGRDASFVSGAIPALGQHTQKVTKEFGTD